MICIKNIMGLVGAKSDFHIFFLYKHFDVIFYTTYLMGYCGGIINVHDSFEHISVWQLNLKNSISRLFPPPTVERVTHVDLFMIPNFASPVSCRSWLKSSSARASS